MKTIFITGASSGLGKAAVKLFQAKGWKVIATMRQPENESELAALGNVTLLPLDVTNETQINTTVQQAIALGKVDVVFNNAGYGLMGPLEAVSDEQITRQLNTNLLGVIRVTKAFIPHFRENKDGIFIATTSIGGLIAFPFHTIYHAAKWAVEGFSESLSFEMKQFNVSVKTVSPGGIATDFTGRSLDFNKHESYERAMGKLVQVVGGEDASTFQFSTPEHIAAVVYEAATDGKDQLRYVAGPDAQALYAQRMEQGPETFRKGIAAGFLN